MNKEWIDRFKRLDTPLISDAMAELSVPGCLLGISCVLPDTLICGEAFTVHYVPCGLDAPSVGTYFDEVKEGQVIVIDNAGRQDCAIWGDITTRVAESRRIAGTVIDGCCRDIKAIRESNYPVFAKGVCMVSGKSLVQVSQTNVLISVAGMRVCPGDLIFGDETGVLCIPASKIQNVLEKAEEIQREEAKILEKLTR